MIGAPHTRRTFREVASSAIAIGVLSIILGTTANVISPRRISWVEDWGSYIEARALKAGLSLITTADAWSFFEQGTHIFLDARTEADYRHARIPGSFSVPFDAMEMKLPEVQYLLSPSYPIVAYCSGEACDESFLLAVELQRQGFTNIVLYAGGIETWVEAGHPAERGP